MKTIDPDALDWNKSQGLLPAIVQHHLNGAVLMLGHMDRAALEQTQQTGKVTFFSRSRNRLWTKGETSGNWLMLRSIDADCDHDTLLLRAEPAGPTCHRGTLSCFGDEVVPGAGFLAELDALVAARKSERPEGSYTTGLFASGVRHIAQKVGEEAVETALAAVVQDDAALLGESADLFFHLLVLLRARGLGLADMSATLKQRHAAKEAK
jgi:phosphoribosyl-AMP cyclohydrolase / phosphoribosyl-ATP pyrophosphohydrolase